MKDLNEVPASEIEKEIGFCVRDKPNAKPTDYLLNILEATRHYAYATRDDSWGELEKELSIILTNYEKMRRYVQSEIQAEMISDSDLKSYDEIYDMLIDQGEQFWQRVQAAKKLVQEFG